MGLYSDSFAYHNEKGTHLVKVREILYFESFERMIRIHTAKNNDDFYGKLDDVYGQLKKFGFFCCHRSYIVNYRYVKLFRYESVILTNGVSLPIGRTKRVMVQELQLKMESGDFYAGGDNI